MAPVAIVSGCPGTGKTTLAASLAGARPNGLHLTADSFFGFIAHVIPPTLPESHAQNATVARATARAAGAFASGGYDVFVDGVLGPWFMPVCVAELAATGVAVDYVVLRADLDQTLRRAASRPAPAPEAVVRQMHRAFADLGWLERCAVDTTGRAASEVLDDVTRRLAAAGFRVDPSEVGADP